MVFCCDFKGDMTMVREEAVLLSPAVYGILIESNRVLLQRNKDTSLWQPPGGLMTSSTSPNRAVRTFFHGLTGVIPVVGPLIYLEEQHVIDPAGQARRMVIMYHALSRPEGAAISSNGTVQTSQPVWVLLSSLSREQMHLGFEAVQIARESDRMVRARAE